MSFYDALRFANWMNNGQGGGDTETGAYTLVGGAPEPTNGTTVTRNAGATIFLTSEDEWYKAAYYHVLPTPVYYDYPAGSDTQTTCATPTALANRANCGFAMGGDLTDVGSYTGSPSPYGTFDQGGNVIEWNESIIGSNRGVRGGGNNENPSELAASTRFDSGPTLEHQDVGFRVAMIPEPNTGLLVISGLLGLGLRRRAAD